VTRPFVILVVATAILLAGGLGLNNGLVLTFDEDHGHLVLESPAFRHIEEHARGADHDQHDHGADADHAGLHDLIVSSSDSHLTTQKIESSSDGVNFSHAHPAPLDLFLTPDLGSQLRRPAGGFLTDAANFRGGTAHIAHVCLKSVILLV